LDRFVQRELSVCSEISRSQVERLIESGCVSVNDKVILKPAFKVESGDVVQVVTQPIETTHLEPFKFELSILFEDEHLLVIDKPAGLSMHPGAGNKDETLANAVVSHVGAAQANVGESDRPGIVHRLDKDTTGVVVVAKSTMAHANLARQFAARTTERSYTALVFTTPRAKRPVQMAESGKVDAPIGRHPTNRKLMAINERGKAAITEWQVIERFSYGTLLKCRLQTGRTHQIRVHMNSIGSPVIGDRTYGDFSNLPRNLREEAELFGRQALHASTLAFTHPITGERLSFESPLPGDFQALLQYFRHRVESE
jgi:23S rRNA pseudouridine1911/1915/1917 synthase